jgi:hypothetical protein
MDKYMNMKANKNNLKISIIQSCKEPIKEAVQVETVASNIIKDTKTLPAQAQIKLTENNLIDFFSFSKSKYFF